MYFKYGDHQHPDNEVDTVVMSRRRLVSPRGFMEKEIRTLVIGGELQASTQDAITALVEELEAAYLWDGRDAALYQDDDDITPHKLLSSDPDNLTGTLVKSLEYPRTDGGEYATARTFRITLEATFDMSEKEVLEFRETLRFIGDCGPRWQAVETAYYAPYRQTISTNSVQRIYQQGYARGLSGYPAIGLSMYWPEPIWPSLEHRHLREQTMIGPDATRKYHLNFGVRWRYVYSASSPQSGQPNLAY